MDWTYYFTAPVQPAAGYPAAGSPAPAANTLRMPFDRSPARPAAVPPTIGAPVSAAILGAVIGGANAFGRNLYRVRQGEMTPSQALVRGLLHGAATSLATTTAAVLTANVSENDLLHLTALAATTAGLSYLISAGVQTAVKKKTDSQTCNPVSNA
jgi:hypothetical protein